MAASAVGAAGNPTSPNSFGEAVVPCLRNAMPSNWNPEALLPVAVLPLTWAQTVVSTEEPTDDPESTRIAGLATPTSVGAATLLFWIFAFSVAWLLAR